MHIFYLEYKDRVDVQQLRSNVLAVDATLSQAPSAKDFPYRAGARWLAPNLTIVRRWHFHGSSPRYGSTHGILSSDVPAAISCINGLNDATHPEFEPKPNGPTFSVQVELMKPERDWPMLLLSAAVMYAGL